MKPLGLFLSLFLALRGVGGFLTHPLSPNPFPPSPGRKGEPHFASGVRHRVNRERLKSGLARQELAPRVPSVGDGVGWEELGIALVSGLDARAGVGVGVGAIFLSRRWRVAASRHVRRHAGTSYDRSRPILPCGGNRDLRAVEALVDTRSQMRLPSFARRGERGAG